MRDLASPVDGTVVDAMVDTGDGLRRVLRPLGLATVDLSNVVIMFPRTASRQAAGGCI